MTVFREFEKEAIRLMASERLPESLLEAVLAARTYDRYEYTGCGYFLTVKHPQLPNERESLGTPPVAGKAGEVDAGFVLHLGDHELTLECHTWGEFDVPENFRDLKVEIYYPLVNHIDLRSAT
jgi:hypothetical protein